MDTQIKKFLEFNNKKVYFLSVNGTWHIAIKPICEALDVDYIQQFKNVKSDKILGPALCVHTMQVPGDQSRKWSCLPEFFVYGWIFSIQSESQALEAYKWKCYELLYNYFHGTITERTGFLKVKTANEIEMERLEAELEENESYKKLKELKGANKKVTKALQKLDEEVVQSQMELWSN